MKRNFVTKITPRDIGLTKAVLDKIADANKDGITKVMRVAGRIMGIKAGQNELGPYTKFSGEFEAINLIQENEDLKIFRAQTLVLTGLGEMVVLDSYNAARAKAPEGAIEVVFDIGIEYNQGSVAKGGRAYKFTVDNLLGSEPSAEDALSKLMSAVGGAIEAPKAPKAAKEKK